MIIALLFYCIGLRSLKGAFVEEFTPVYPETVVPLSHVQPPMDSTAPAPRYGMHIQWHP